MRTLRFTCLAVLLLLQAAVSSAHAQSVWNRQAFGQDQISACDGHHFNFPNNNNWNQELSTYCCDNACSSGTFTGAPSNWSTPAYPREGDVVIGGNGGATNCNVNITLNNLTITPDGALTMDTNSRIAAQFFNFQGNNDANAFLAQGGFGGGQLVVLAGGTMKKTAGNGTFQIDANVGVEALNGGTIACDSGALQLPRGKYVGPSQPEITPIHFDAATGALIDLAPAGATGVAVLVSGQFTGINTGGTVRMSNGEMYAVDGGATFDFGGDTFQWQGGFIQSALDSPLVNAGTMNVTAGTPAIRSTGFTNNGTFRQSGTGTFTMFNGTWFTNNEGALFDLQNDNGIGYTAIGGGATLFRNYGTLRKSAGSGRSVIDPSISVLNFGAVIRVDSGTLALASGLATDEDHGPGFGSGGSLEVNPNGTLELNDGSSFAIYNGTYTASGGGTILLAGGNIGASRFAVPGGYTFDFAPGIFQWTGGVINGGSDAEYAFRNAGSIAVAGPAALGGTFINNGSITQSGIGGLQPACDTCGGTFTNNADGVYDIQNNSGLANNFRLSFNNAGTLLKSAGTGTSVVAFTFSNSGKVIVKSGALEFTDGATRGPARSYYQSAGVTEMDGGDLSFPGAPAVFDGGALIGSGVITGTVVNHGAVVGPGHSPGKITITGDYTQEAGGALNIELGGNTAGTGYDQLVVKGTAHLGGTLNISTINGYRPSVGDVITIINAPSFTGSFAQVNANGLGVDINYASGAITATVTSVPDILLNISTRLDVQTGDNVLIGGFIVTGSEGKKVIIRGMGPSLSGVSGLLADPTLELIDSDGATLLFNDDWKESQQTEIEASGIAPTKDAEAAIVRTLDPGAYTAVLRGKDGTTGIGTLELYDLSQAAKAKLANISSRGHVDTGDNALIGGFIVGGGGNSAGANVVVRAIGPSLGETVSGSLADPRLELIDANGSTVRSNDNWKSDQQAELEAIGIQPTNDLEAALLATVPAGAYTAVVRGTDNRTGVAVVEIYNVE